MRKEFVFGKICISLLLLFVIFLSSCKYEMSRIEATEPIKIAINSVWPGYAHTFIAKEKQLFEKNGVNVELIKTKDDTESREYYINEEVDGFYNVYSDIIVLLNSKGIPAKVVYVADYSDSGDVIIGKPEFNSLADLKGKKIGIEGINSFSHLFVLTASEKQGVEEFEIQFENVFARDVLTALEEGKIDAGHTWEPTKSEALKKGYKTIGKAGDVPGIITDVLAFSPEIIKERPEDVKSIIKSILEARDFVYTNQEEALAIMANQTGVGTAELSDGIKGVVQPNLVQNIEAMKKSGETTSLYHSGEIIVDFYLERGQILSSPNFDDIIEERFVNTLK